MNLTVRKKIAIIAAAVLALGIIVVGVGVFLGGSLSYGIDYQRHNLSTNRDVMDETMEVESFKNMDIQLSAADLQVVYGDSYEVHYVLPERLVPAVKVEGDTLRITSPSNIDWNVGLQLFEDVDYGVVITVPEGTKLGDVKLNIDAGDTTVNDISAESLTVDTDAGDVNVEKTTTTTLHADTNAGDVEFTAVTSDRVEAKSDAGEIKVERLDAKDIRLESNAGDITGTVVGEKEDYAGEAEADVGDVTIDGADEGRKCHFGKKAERELHIDVSVGDAEIEFIGK
ncbi:MAG: DUF4097 domain-containing protein [Lachnospiraceae bacterium]|nr:DUF4097 domain-containing protein [Lachnospiraceae bacterium]